MSKNGKLCYKLYYARKLNKSANSHTFWLVHFLTPKPWTAGALRYHKTGQKFSLTSRYRLSKFFELVFIKSILYLDNGKDKKIPNSDNKITFHNYRLLLISRWFLLLIFKVVSFTFASHFTPKIELFHSFLSCLMHRRKDEERKL